MGLEKTSKPWYIRRKEKRRRKPISRWKKSFPEELARVEVALTETVQLVVRLVNIQNVVWVDIRKWVRWTKDPSLHPSPKGICLELEQLKEEILPALHQLCHNTSHNADQSSTEGQRIDNPMPDQKA